MSKRALRWHLRHGDTLGPCPGDEATAGDWGHGDDDKGKRREKRHKHDKHGEHDDDRGGKNG